MTKGLVFNIQHFSIHDGPGIRTTIFLKGCPLDCPWCSNPESKSTDIQILHTPASCIECMSCTAACPYGGVTIKDKIFIRDVTLCTHCLSCVAACPTHALSIEGTWYSVDELLAEVEKDRAFYEKSGGGITLSGGEPLMQKEFTMELLTALKKHGYHTTIETTGYTDPQYLKSVLPYLDLIYMDCKHPDNTVHLSKIGVENKLILRNMQQAAASGCPLVVRIPVIPRFNNSEETAFLYGQTLKEIGVSSVHLLPFHQMGLGKWRALNLTYEYENDRSMGEDELQQMADIISSFEIQVQISGS